MAPSFLLLHVITNEKSLKFTQIGRLLSASRASPQKHVPTTLVGIPVDMYTLVGSTPQCSTNRPRRTPTRRLNTFDSTGVNWQQRRTMDQRIVTVQKNFRGVKIFHLLLGAIRLQEYILFVKEQISRVSRWCVQKIFFQKYTQLFFIPTPILENIDDISRNLLKYSFVIV